MTTHIWKEKVHYPPSNTSHWAHRMYCGLLLPKDFGPKNSDESYVTIEMVTKNYVQGFGGGSWENECEECFSKPEIQLLILGSVDL